MQAPSTLALTGATGMIGGHALDMALGDPRVGRVVSFGRRPSGRSDDRLREVQHDDFGDCASLVPELGGVDAALYCIGTYTGVVPDAQLRAITVDHVLSFARALREASPDAAFCLLSGSGADRTESSRIAFARYKGMVENGLVDLGFPRVHFARPGYIYPVVPRREPTFFYRLFRAVFPVVRLVAPRSGIPSDTLARAMLNVSLDPALAGQRSELEMAELFDLGEPTAGS